jgi:hypothetical protein
VKQKDQKIRRDEDGFEQVIGALIAAPSCPFLIFPIFLFALLSLLGACGSPAKREALSLSEAVDRYRHATSSTSAVLSAGVGAVACTDAQVCEAKRACAAAADATERAVVLKEDVSLRLADIEGARLAPSSAEAQSLPGKLDEATRLLREGRTGMNDCDKRLTDLVVRFGP